MGQTNPCEIFSLKTPGGPKVPNITFFSDFDQNSKKLNNKATRKPRSIKFRSLIANYFLNKAVLVWPQLVNVIISNNGPNSKFWSFGVHFQTMQKSNRHPDPSEPPIYLYNAWPVLQ